MVWLYRGQDERFAGLLAQHLRNAVRAAEACWLVEEGDKPIEPMDEFARAYKALRELMQPFVDTLPERGEDDAVIGEYLAADTDPLGPIEGLRQFTSDLSASHLRADQGFAGSVALHRDVLVRFADVARSLVTTLDRAVRAAGRLLDLAEKQLGAKPPLRCATAARRFGEQERADAG